MSPASLPLAGVRVLECCHFIAGPRCTQLMADHGADVIKLEPLAGDPSRSSPPVRDGWSMYFAAHNRRKRSVAADLKSPAGQEILKKLIGWADVLVTNYTPGASERLGLAYEQAKAINPRLVVVRISAYGLTGPDRDKPGFDGTVQARSGLAHMTGPEDRPPTVTSFPMVDFLVAVEGAYAAMLGLRTRDATGVGTEIDVSMMDSAAPLLAYLYSEVLVGGQDPIRTGSRAPYALTGAYPTADGFLYIAPIGEAPWRRLAELIGRPEWGERGADYTHPQRRLENRDLIEDQIGGWTKTLTSARLTEVLEAAGIPCGVVNTVRQAAESSMMADRHMLEWVGLGRSQTKVPMPGVELKVAGEASLADAPTVPELGAHTDDVLAELGIDAETVARWAADGSIRNAVAKGQEPD